FFSTRRRHTRFSRDWSSDVCSSDLADAQRGRHPHRAALVLDQAAHRVGGHALLVGVGHATVTAVGLLDQAYHAAALGADPQFARSEERRGGEESRSVWWRADNKQNK